MDAGFLYCHHFKMNMDDEMRLCFYSSFYLKNKILYKKLVQRCAKDHVVCVLYNKVNKRYEVV